MKKVLIIGDLIIDKYISGNVSRISPEAPVPILNYQSNFIRFGGAANLAISTARLIGKCSLTFCGESSEISFDELKNEDITLIKVGHEKKYSVKTRFISGHHQLLRLDDDFIQKRSLEDYLIHLKKLSKKDIIVISDYEKGAASNSKDIINYANSNGIKTLIDPKNPNWEMYANSSCIKCNKKEFTDQRKFSGLDEEINKKNIIDTKKRFGINSLIITLGKDGLMISNSNNKIIHFKGEDIPVFDVSGAGDAVLSGIVYLYFNDLDSINHGRFLTKLGEICVQEIGTSPVPKGIKIKNFLI